MQDRPSRLRSFDPNRIADLEYRAWTGYYLRKWPQVLIASVGLVRTGFGMDWYRTLHGAWLVLRANQLWAPYPANDPEGARRCMRRFYALVRLTYGAPADPSKAAEREVEWWRAHRESQYSTEPRGAGDELVEAVTRLYASCTPSRRTPFARPPQRGPRRWTCPTSGSRRAARLTATCCRLSTPRSCGRTRPCWPRSITEPAAVRHGRGP